MNDQLQHALASLLGKAVSGMDAATSFLSAQLPDVIHQLLLWSLIDSLAHVFIPILLLLISGFSLYRCGTKLWNKDDPYHVAKRQYELACEVWMRTSISTEQGRQAAAEYRRVREEFSKMAVPEENPVLIGTTIISGTATLFCTAATIACLNLTWLQILVAPKTYLIEYAAHLAK